MSWIRRLFGIEKSPDKVVAKRMAAEERLSREVKVEEDLEQQMVRICSEVSGLVRGNTPRLVNRTQALLRTIQCSHKIKNKLASLGRLKEIFEKNPKILELLGHLENNLRKQTELAEDMKRQRRKVPV